ncbi:uncharacterized protein LOC110691360 [Chenopodium quinoa]|uniref:uncharacterized protein LOC110691360 n=1 Tax=Chenopodium quinoa TaxID=63459 RepID=UPI000B76DDEE|nr:uncharacterized protein LOC110691360 [Chenopodium quinoa]
MSEAAKGKATDEEVPGTLTEDQGAPSLIEYEESEDEAFSPTGSDEDANDLRRRRKNALLNVGGYLAALECCNPGTDSELVTVMPKQPLLIFERLFICFEGLARGWIEGCRKVLVVDGCFLKNSLGGQLLCAVGSDSNDQMFLVDWAVTKGENSLSWEWFLKHLQAALELGIFGACWHSNFVWLVVYGVVDYYAGYPKWVDYDEALAKLNEINVEAVLAFKAYNPQHFCRAFLISTDIKTDAITINIAETLNGYIINARTKHLLHMLEDIRFNLMHRMVKKKQLIEKCTSVQCPRIQPKLNQEKYKSAMCEMSEAKDFVHQFYTKERYMKAYAGSIPPLVGERYWPKVTYQLQPPSIKIRLGRPRKKRVKDPFENPKKPGVLTKAGVGMTFSLCNVKGHNKRKCPEKGKIVPPEPAAKRPRGRPRGDEQQSNQNQT